ncbi:beta strand repeat-containing protein [Phascolarctobacterium faecium]|uniref:beta strand repeat-containing protein n=1 Tax=Phascolarctobacterium faecium TaxID=33025 RepID=UPI003A8EC49D
MSKREIRAKRLVAAVLLAISVQMWSAPPLWAAEASVQTETSAAGEAKETKDAKDAKAADSETGGEADAGEEETVVVPVIGYSTRSAAGSDYGVMPLADTAVDGALTGVTSINDAKFYADSHDLLLGYDAKSQGTGTVALGSDANAGGQYSTAIGASASATAENSSALGMYARAGFKDSVAIGFSSNATADNMVSFGVTENGGSTWTTRRSLEGIANIDMEGTINLGGTWTKNASGIYESNGKGKLTGLTSINDTEVFIGNDGDALVVNIGAYLGPNAMGTISLGEGNYVDGSYAISLGYNVTTEGSYSVSIGAVSSATKDHSTALGGDAYAEGVGSTAIGYYSRIEGENSTALGANSTVAAEHTNSVAIGSESATSAADQVSFGHKAGDKQSTSGSATYDTDLFRSLTNISDIEMHGNISLGGEWSWNETSKVYESNGKGRLTGLTSINDMDVYIGEKDGGTIINIGSTVGYDAFATISLGAGNSVDGLYSISIGNNASATGNNSITVGSASSATADYSTALGSDTDAVGENSTAIGYMSRVGAKNSTGLGANTSIAAEHTNSVAVGAESVTSAADQVSFGHKAGDKQSTSGSATYDTDLFRSLTNISDIGMHGALTGVTSINGNVIVPMNEDVTNKSLAIGTGAAFTSRYSSETICKNAIVIGNGTSVAGDGALAIGYRASSDSNNGVAIGSNAYASYDGTALGYAAQGNDNNAVAIGAYSGTTEENQVSFGHKAGDTNYADHSKFTDDLFRSLVNVADIDMHGNISLGGKWKENTTSGLYESNGKGELNGVTSINGVIFAKDSMNNQEGLLIGTLAPDTYYSGGFSVMIGTDIDNQAIDAVGIGNNIKLTGDGSVAIGNGAQSLEDGIAIGFSSHAIGYDVVAIGTYSYSEYANSVALGSKSVALEENQVSFGHKADDKDSEGDIYGSDLFRSLVNVADIEMHGALTGVTGIDGVTVSGTDASTGLTVGGNAVIGKTNTPFSSTGFAVDKEGAVTAKTVNGATITGTGFNGVTLSTDGKVNGAAITSNSFNGVTLEKDASSHYKVGGVDVTKMQTDVAGKADAATTLTGYGITDAYTKTETDTAVGKKADKATTLTGYGIADAYTKTETDTAIGKKADKATTLTGYGIADAYTKTETDTAIGKKADKATTLTGYGIADAYTKTETDTAIGKKADKATTLTGYGITDAYTKTAADAKITAATADMATKTQVTADIGTAKTALESAYQAADTALGSRSAALETKTAKFNTAGDNLTGMANITSTAATLGGVGFASAGVMTGVASIDGIAIDASRNLSKAGTYNGVTVAVAGISGTSVFNGAAITNNSFNGVTLEKGADNHYKVGGVDVSALKTTVDSISADGVGTADTAGIKRDTTGTATTSIETNTKISSSGITTNKVTVSGATATTLENGKLTVGAATVQNIGFAVGSSSLNNGSLTVDGNNKLTTAGLTASKVTVGAVTVSGGKVSGLTDAALSAVSTEAVTGKQLNATNTTVSALDTAYKAADTQIRTDFAAADTTLQNNIDAKVAQTAYDTKMSDLDSADTALGSRAAALETAVNDSTTGLAAVNTKVGALDTAYQAADTQIRTDFAAADTALKTELNTAIDEKAKKATDLAGYGITDAYTKTAADEKITAATADMATKTQVTADIGTAKTALESAYQAADTALSDRAAALETAATGMSYDAGKNTTTFTGGVTATVLTAGEFKVGATGFGFGNDGALTAKTVNGIEIKKDESKVMVGGIDLTALSNGDVVTDNTKGIGRNQDTATTTIETNTAISSSGITTNAVTASGTVKASEFVEGDKKLSDKYAAKTALDDYTTTTDMNTKFADYATTTAVDTKLADYAKSDSVYSKAAADTAFAKAGDVDTLKTTVGDTDGGLVKDVKDLQSGKADNATTLAGYGIADAYTQTEINEKIVEATKDLATSATVTDIQSGLEEVTGKTAGLSYDTASGSSKFSGSVVIGNEGAKTHTQITDDAIIFGEGTDKQVTVDASGIHVGKKAAGGIALYADADGTHIDHTSLVTGSVTADNLNGVAISGNATDGLSVGGVSIKALSERLDSLEQDGVATADMGGIKRTDVVENSGKTIIEDTTSFTKDGLKTANLEAATAALGGVNFAAGAVTGVSSINGVVFGSDGKIGGVSLSGGKVDGVDVGWLDQRVKSLEDNGTGGGGTGGGGSSANTSGIHKPDSDTTNIEGNTSITTDGIDTNKVNASDSIVVADGEKNKTVISKDGILVAEGEKNQVKINEDGIHVGKNSSVVNDTDGFITDKGLYIGVSSSSDTSTAKFSVAPNGNLSSKAGDYGFSNTSADGAKFTHSGDTAYGTGSQLDTTIQGNKVTTGRIDTDELYVDGNKVTVAGGTIGQTDAVDNHLSGTDADGNTVTNDFKTSAVNGTTQAAEKTSADGKESTKTVNNTSAGGTSVTTSRTTTDSKDNVTVKESNFGTNEKGMTLSTSNKVTDKDGKVTKDTSGTTTMTGDSISVSKTTTTTEKDADGNEKEVTKTSGTTIGSGEVTLKREDGSTIEVGSAIEGMQSDMRELDGRVNRMGVEIKEVGALSAALAGLHPQPENANSRADFAMAMGSYEGKQALAVGGFYRPDKRTMLSIGASTTSSKHMMNMGISIALDRLPEAERRAKEAAKAAGVEQETLNRVLERLAALEQDNRRLQADNEKRDVAYEKLAADYTQLKEKYIEETADRQQPEQAEAEE